MGARIVAPLTLVACLMLSACFAASTDEAATPAASTGLNPTATFTPTPTPTPVEEIVLSMERLQ